MDETISKIKLSEISDRFFASLIDGLVVKSPIGFLFYTTTAGFPLTVLLGLLFHASYYILSHSPVGGGQTLGKRLMGLRVVSISGEPATFGQGTIRYLVFAPPIMAFAVLWLGLPIEESPEILFSPRYILIALTAVQTFIGLSNTCYYLVNPQGRAWHDALAGTIVLKTGKRVDSSTNAQCISEKTQVIRSGRWMVCGLLIAILVGASVFVRVLVIQHPNAYASRTAEEILKTENIRMTGMKNDGELLLIDAKYPYSTFVRFVEDSAVPSRLARAVEALNYLEILKSQKTSTVQFQISTQPESKPPWRRVWNVNVRTLEVQALETTTNLRHQTESKPPARQLTTRELDAQLTPFLHKNWERLTEEMNGRDGLMSPLEIAGMVRKLREAVVEKARKSDARIIQTEEAYDNFQRTPRLFDVALKCKKAIHTMTEYLKLIRQLGAKTPAASNILDAQIAYFTAAEGRLEKHIAAIIQTSTR